MRGAAATAEEQPRRLGVGELAPLHAASTPWPRGERQRRPVNEPCKGHGRRGGRKAAAQRVCCPAVFHAATPTAPISAPQTWKRPPKASACRATAARAKRPLDEGGADSMPRTSQNHAAFTVRRDETAPGAVRRTSEVSGTCGRTWTDGCERRSLWSFAVCCPKSMPALWGTRPTKDQSSVRCSLRPTKPQPEAWVGHFCSDCLERQCGKGGSGRRARPPR